MSRVEFVMEDLDFCLKTEGPEITTLYIESNRNSRHYMFEYRSVVEVIKLLTESEAGTKLKCDAASGEDYIMIRKTVITFYYDCRKVFSFNLKEFRNALLTEYLLGN